MTSKIKKTGRIDEYLCYYSIFHNPLLFRNFFLPLILGDAYEEIYGDSGNILSTNLSEQDLEKFINTLFPDWRNISREKRIKKFFLLLDEGNWRGMHNKPNYISRLFKDVDYFDRVLLMWYREGGKKKELAWEIIDEICKKIINYYIVRYSMNLRYNQKVLCDELKGIAYATYIEALERNYRRKRRYIKPSLSKKYVTDFVQKRLLRYLEKKIEQDEKTTRILQEDNLVSPDKSPHISEEDKENFRKLKKFNEQRLCSDGVRKSIDMHLNGAKPRHIAKMQGILPNTASKRIERFHKAARKSFPKNSS